MLPTKRMDLHHFKVIPVKRCGQEISKTCVLCCVLSHVQLFLTPWTVAHLAPLSMGFSRQEYWSRFPFPPPGDLPDPGIEPASLASPALTGRFLTTSTTWEAQVEVLLRKKNSATRLNLDLQLQHQLFPESPVCQLALQILDLSTSTTARASFLTLWLTHTHAHAHTHTCTHTHAFPIGSVSLENTNTDVWTLVIQ